MTIRATETEASDMRFAWRGVDATGTQRNGTLIAADAAAVRAMLKRDNLFIIELTARGPAPRPHARASEVTLFTRQLASLLRAGLPLAPSLELLAQAPAPRQHGMSRIVGALARDITSGLSFSAALPRHPAQFNALYCQLVAVGEAAGALPAVLARIADDRERGAAQRAKVKRRPHLSRRDPAAGTRHHCCTADLGRANVQTDLRRLRRPLASADTNRDGAIGRRCALERAGARIDGVCRLCRGLPAAPLGSGARRGCPPVAVLAGRGHAARTLCAARWSRALGTLLSAGTPLADAFDSLTHATGNAFFDRATVDIAARLRRGERLAAAMRAARCFPPRSFSPLPLPRSPEHSTPC